MSSLCLNSARGATWKRNWIRSKRQQCCSSATLARRQKARKMSVLAYQESTTPDETEAPVPQASSARIMLIGATGGTGWSVLKGMQVMGFGTDSVQLLTTNAASERSQKLLERGLSLVEGDLDDVDSLSKALEGVQFVYCHALSKDAAAADPKEVQRGQNLANAAVRAGVQHIVYNGAGGYGSGCPMTQMQQKHRVQELLTAALPSTTTLQATLFMEELWKQYTRPAVLKGKFPFALAGDKSVQLVSVRDMGVAAATVLLKPKDFEGKAIELAGDELTINEMCKVFSTVQGSEVVHNHIWWLALLARIINPDLYYFCKFLGDKGFTADVSTCRTLFPDLLTFEQFLTSTRWADTSRTYDDGVEYFD